MTKVKSKLRSITNEFSQARVIAAHAWTAARRRAAVLRRRRNFFFEAKLWDFRLRIFNPEAFTLSRTIFSHVLADTVCDSRRLRLVENW